MALAAASACGEQSNIDPGAAVSVEGTILDVDGSGLTDRPVRLGSGVTLAEGGLAVLSVGLLCLGDICSGDSFDTTTTSDGTFAFALEGRDTQSALGEATSFVLSTSAEPPEDRPSGPAVSVGFRVQTPNLALPVLPLVDVRPTIQRGDGGSVTVSWDGGAAPAPYTIEFLDTDGGPVWGLDTTETSAIADGRILEDVTGLATVLTRRTDAVEGSDLDVVFRSSGVAFRGGFGPPPSRGAGCELHGEGGAIQTLETCPLTDADFGAGGLTEIVCPTAPVGAANPECQDATRVRVMFGQPIAAQLVVVRGCTDPCLVGVVGEDGSATEAAPISGPFGSRPWDERPIHGVEVATPELAGLTEVSVWPAVTVPGPLLLVSDPGELLGGQPGSDGGTGRRSLVSASVLLVLVVLILGVVIGRRSRTTT